MAAQLLALACCMLGLACKYRLYFTTYPTSSSFGFSHQGSPQRICHLQLFLSSVSSSVTSISAMSSFTTSITSFLAFPVSSFLATPSSSSSCVSCFLSKPSHLHCPYDVLIPDLVQRHLLFVHVTSFLLRRISLPMAA